MNPLAKRWIVIAIGLVSSAEGLRQYAYRDPVGIPTICFGETKGVKMGQHATVDECKAMLSESLMLANAAVSNCTKTSLPDERRAALVSFTYNVGGANYCKSTLVKKLNKGDTAGACDELRKWVYAKGVKLPGLVNRREQERALCIKGLA